MDSDVYLNKKATIERCLKRIHTEYQQNPENLTDLRRQDAVVLNLQRACEASIDLAMHVVSMKKLGIPQQSREAFQILSDAKIIPAELSDRLKRMVGFRNIAIHDYQSLNISILKQILDSHLDDFSKFLSALQTLP